MKNLTFLLLLVLFACQQPPEQLRPSKVLYVHIVEARFRVPNYTMCGSYYMYDTTLSDTSKYWYNLSMRDSTLPCAQYVIAHGKQGTVTTKDTIRYAHFLVHKFKTIGYGAGTSDNVYNQFGNCDTNIKDTKKWY